MLFLRSRARQGLWSHIPALGGWVTPTNQIGVHPKYIEGIPPKLVWLEGPDGTITEAKLKLTEIVSLIAYSEDKPLSCSSNKKLQFNLLPRVIFYYNYLNNSNFNNKSDKIKNFRIQMEVCH
jgi:hypothetical protein